MKKEHPRKSPKLKFWMSQLELEYPPLGWVVSGVVVRCGDFFSKSASKAKCWVERSICEGAKGAIY